MTLTQFEAQLTTLPSGRATQAASASHALRVDLGNGEAPFTTARDRIAGQAWIREALLDADLLDSFVALSGP
jgi:uncharacterized protein (UPF0548 family)